MADKPINTSTVDTIVSSKAGLVTDLNPSYIGKDSYSHARNITRNSQEGDLGTVGNEPSNELCFEAPFKVIGTVDLPDDRILVLSGDGRYSEVGIGDLINCTYTKIVINECFGFNPNYPIKGVAKNDFNKGIVVTITDKLNPVRRFELDKLAKITDCDDTLLFRKINVPCLTLKAGINGNIPNGTYSVAMAYSVDNQIHSDFFGITTRRILYNKTSAHSLEVSIDNIDTSFGEYSLVLIGNYVDPTTNQATKLAKIVGTYSTKITKVTISDFINPSYPVVPLSSLVIKNKTWQKAGIISSNASYLMLGDLVARPEENYQLKAMGIEAECIIEQVPVDYYEKNGGDISYYGDENYDFYIQGVYTTGEMTDKFHIPGRKPKPSDLALIATADVYEYDQDSQYCLEPGTIKRWQVENTAGKLHVYPNSQFKCDRRLVGKIDFGYVASTELYPDNTAMFGEDANTPIRYHKFPDECKVPRYSVYNGKKYINIKGIRFKNIPKFDNPDIVGYKITRSDRKGGNGTVVARGLMTNVRSYKDLKTQETIKFSNYPVNDLSPDQFLSATQTGFKNGKEFNFTPLKDYYKDKFSFYSPHTMFEPRYTLGNEIKIESEEVAVVKGRFERVYNHPKAKLLNQFSFWLAAAVGFIEATMVIMGKNTHYYESRTITTPPGKVVISGQDFKINTVADLMALDIPAFYTSKFLSTDPIGVAAAIKAIIQIILSIGIKVPYSILSGMVEADKMLEIIYNLTGYTDYVYQYNAHADFIQSKCVKSGNKRRALINPAVYIPDEMVSVNGETFNNVHREKTVYLELNKEIAEPTTKDNTRNTMSGLGVCESDDKSTVSTGSAYYATSKVNNPNQYGKLGSSAPVVMHSCVLPFNEGDTTETPILYGGDCVITRFQFQKRMQFFNQTLSNTNYPDGVEYDYRLYRNIAYPRFWMDTTKYDFSALLNSTVVNFTRFNRTTSQKHNLDCKKKNDGESISRIDDAYMYTSNNAVLDFIVEADYNPNFREETEHPFYSRDNNNLSQIFRQDRLDFPEEFVINRALFDIYTTEIYADQQRDDFDPKNPIPVKQPNSVIYSLPSFNLQEADNWQYFLPLNYFAFRESDFGKLTAIHKLDQDRIVFLFSKSSPYVSIGRDFLELEQSGRKITIGDGGLFAQDPREIMPTDNNYGACNSKYAFANTHLGKFYPSAVQGRILEFTDKSLDDITKQGISYWCKNYMPIHLYKYFQTYPKEENPINGVGYLMAFDSFYETIYITKRDFVPKDGLGIKWDESKNSFVASGNKIHLRDPKFFNDVSWTLSYSPLEKAFISWHDWHPDWIVQTENHFISVKENGFYKHNETTESFCNFYGVDHPFEIEFVAGSGQTVETVRNIEYILEAYKYKNFGRDRFHMLNENFDRLIVHNTEQISPLLHLKFANPNPEENLEYPRKNLSTNISYDVAYFKEENKYRVNQFWDTVRDRGEFTNAQNHIFPTDQSGYKQVINPLAVDINKPEEQRKKFRHYWNKFRLIRTVSGETKFICKLVNVKKLISIR